MARSRRGLLPHERIDRAIYLIRGEKVILDQDLASLYEVETKALVQAVKRNRDRFPSDFMFQLSEAEFAELKSQIVTSSWGARRARLATGCSASVAFNVERSIIFLSPPVITSKRKDGCF